LKIGFPRATLGVFFCLSFQAFTMGSPKMDGNKTNHPVALVLGLCHPLSPSPQGLISRSWSLFFLLLFDLDVTVLSLGLSLTFWIFLRTGKPSVFLFFLYLAFFTALLSVSLILSLQLFLMSSRVPAQNISISFPPPRSPSARCAVPREMPLRRMPRFFLILVNPPPPPPTLFCRVNLYLPLVPRHQTSSPSCFFFLPAPRLPLLRSSCTYVCDMLCLNLLWI